MDLIHKGLGTALPGLDLFEGHAVHTTLAMVGSGDPVGAGQYVAPIDPVIQGVKPKLRLLLRLKVKLLSQRREFLRQWNRLLVRGRPYLNVHRLPQRQLFCNGPVDQAALLSSDSACPRQGPLAPRALPRFLATMGLSDSRHGPLQVMDSLQTLAARPPPCRASQVPRCDCPSALSPTTPGCPVVAHARCFTTGGRLRHLWQVDRTHKRNEAEPGSLALGLTCSQSGKAIPFAVRHTAATGPLPMLGCPDMGDRCYMMNEQLSWLTPFSQQVAPGLSWRSKVRKEKPFRSKKTLCVLCGSAVNNKSVLCSRMGVRCTSLQQPLLPGKGNFG